MAKERFSVDTPLWTATLFQPLVFMIAIVCITFGLPDISMGTPKDMDIRSAVADRAAHRNWPQAVLIAANENSEATPTTRGGKNTNNENAERWKALPSDEKKELRKRMDQWRNLTPQQQEKYRRRHEKLQKMTPSQRQKVDQGLEKWDTLQPKEKEEIRRMIEE